MDNMKNCCGGSGADTNEMADKSEMTRPDVQVVSSENADFNPGRGGPEAGSHSPVKALGK